MKTNLWWFNHCLIFFHVGKVCFQVSYKFPSTHQLDYKETLFLLIKSIFSVCETTASDFTNVRYRNGDTSGPHFFLWFALELREERHWNGTSLIAISYSSYASLAPAKSSGQSPVRAFLVQTSSLTSSLILLNKCSSVAAISARVRPRRSFSSRHPGGSPLIHWERYVSSGQGDSIEFISFNWELSYHFHRSPSPVALLDLLKLREMFLPVRAIL